MAIFTISFAKAHLLQLINRAVRGEEIVIDPPQEAAGEIGRLAASANGRANSGPLEGKSLGPLMHSTR